jgi:hypothetical protein
MAGVSNDFTRSSMTSLLTIGAFLRRTGSALRDFFALLIRQPAGVSSIKNSLFYLLTAPRIS